MDLQGHTFLVIGGASGLGAATARRFCTAGAHVVIADPPRKGLDPELTDRLSEQHSNQELHLNRFVK